MKDRSDDKVRPSGGSGKLRWTLATLLLAGLVALAAAYWPQGWGAETEGGTPDLRPTLAALSTSLAQARRTPSAPSPTSSPEPAPSKVVASQRGRGTVVYAGEGQGRSHLWVIEPGAVEGRPLTTGDWNDADPAVDPQGRRLAFRSDRDGFWDLYLLDLATGDTRRLTETPDYEGHPTWSPDGRWLAYEGYREGDLDIWILAIDGQQAPIQLTNHPGLDASPSWEPGGGRRIAFISDRDGSRDVFLADLDRPNDRFINLTGSEDWAEMDPAFGPDGDRIAYATSSKGIGLIWTIRPEEPEALPQQIGLGSHPVWSPDGRSILAIQSSPHQHVALTYDLEGGGTPIALHQRGLELAPAWTQAEGIPSMAEGTAVVSTGSQGSRTAVPAEGAGRMSLIALGNVEAPNPQLVEAADEPFRRLRAAIEDAAGWDFLGSLDAAFVGLNDPLPPGFAYNDWLYTGRAFSFQLSAYRAGWVEVVREDFGNQTYWRVFVRTAAQDGSQGRPLQDRPWDFSARYRGDPSDYDQGGLRKERIPAGYYADFTAMAEAHGFERVPALTNWRSFFPGARFNEFAYTEGLSWLAAMQQLYPPEALATPTPFSSPTPTPTNTPWPTPTPWWWRWRTPTPTPLPPSTPLPTAATGP